MARRNDSADGATIIKKYANRRLYNTASSSYITLEDLARPRPPGRATRLEARADAWSIRERRRPKRDQ